jgi:hypothetical protein
MVRGGTITADQPDNRAQCIIATHGQTSRTRHHNRSQKVRRENRQHEPLGEPKTNAWAPPETKDIDDEDEVSDCDNSISPGPKSSDSESDSSTDEEATDKSKAIHARDHKKREQEKK